MRTISLAGSDFQVIQKILLIGCSELQTVDIDFSIHFINGATREVGC